MFRFQKVFLSASKSVQYFPGKLVILPGMAICKSFAIKHVKCAGKERWRYKRSIINYCLVISQNLH